ncbi:hypothetical protein PINS_up004679 [Pythium insidiosum]|nr:hypothetical protein PINS_up004679 [Pythium insidiosum]
MSANASNAANATTREGHSNSWIEEQAAEYADLVGSFVESVHDEETDEMIEYQLIWEGGDLGVALTPMENADVGVMVSRVTGKGFPFGIKNVGSGDILLSINLHDTTKLTLDQVVAYLQECDLPATLRFKKVSPDLDRVLPPPMPRSSNFVITSDTPTSPLGSQRPSSASVASSRMSQKSVISVGTYQQQQQRQTRGPSSASRASTQYGRMSVASQPRPSDAGMVPPPPATVRAAHPQVAAQATASAQPKQEHNNTPPAAPVASQSPSPVPAPTAASASSSSVDQAAAGLHQMAVGGAAAAGERDSWRSSEDIDAARERAADMKKQYSSRESTDSAFDQSPPGVRPKAQSVAMLGDYSIQATGIPILPEKSMSAIASIDGIVEMDEDASPVGHAVQPAPVRGSTDEMVKPDIPRDSVRMTLDGPAEPMMKTEPVSALHELCAKGNLRSVMQHLKVNGPDMLVHREPNHGQTCLHLAVKSGNVQLVKHILEQYEPVEEIVNIEDDKGNTALHFAATKTPGMVHLLLESGASANVKNSRKLTPLIISVITSRDDNVIIPRMLLKYGANPNDMHDSQTVIHTAIGSGLLNIAGALIRAGAKMDVEDSDGKNVFEKLDKKSIRFLISHIYFPPTYITEKERTDCMVCHKKIKFGHRKNNCTHCGRLCCSECCALSVEMYKMPMGFPGRVRKGAAVRDPKKVCKTCYGVFKERGDTPQKEETRFIKRVIGVEWDEVNPNKLVQERSAGRRGERDY